MNKKRKLYIRSSCQWASEHVGWNITAPVCIFVGDQKIPVMISLYTFKIRKVPLIRESLFSLFCWLTGSQIGCQRSSKRKTSDASHFDFQSTELPCGDKAWTVNFSGGMWFSEALPAYETANIMACSEYSHLPAKLQDLFREMLQPMLKAQSCKQGGGAKRVHIGTMSIDRS